MGPDFTSRNDHRYTSLTQTSRIRHRGDLERTPSAFDSGPRTRKVLQTALVSLMIMTGILVGFWTAKLKSITKAEQFHWKSCGSSTTEALELDCIFDVMMNGWIPRECYNWELSESYILSSNARFFADSFGKVEVPLDIYRKGNHRRVWTTVNHHLSHCAFMWRLQSIALANQTAIDEDSLNIEHTMHCAQALLRGHHYEEEKQALLDSRMPIVINSNFMSCRLERTI